MKLEQDEKKLLELKIQDLLLRYQFHGASLRLAEELSNDLTTIGDESQRHHLFERAGSLASVNNRFFESFFGDRTFLTTYRNGKEIFKIHYSAALLTASASLWAEVMRLALLPDIDFELSDLVGICPFSTHVANSTPTPILFASPDLFLGTADFPMSLTLVNHLKTRWASTMAEVQETAVSLGAATGVELSAMTHLFVAALSIGAAHCTGGPRLWTVVRGAAQENLKELLEKLSTDVESPSGRACAWSAWCESWRVRLLYYRQLSQPALHLSDLIDEYKLFEFDLPDALRIIKIPSRHLVQLGDLRDLQNFVCEEISRAFCESPETDSAAATARDACIELAEKLLTWSDKRWRTRKKFEVMASALHDDTPLLVLGEDNKLSEEMTHSTDCLADMFDSPKTFSEHSRQGQDDWLDDETCYLPNAKQSFHLWTEYINFEEEELMRLSDFLSQKRNKIDDMCVPASEEESINLVSFVQNILLDPRARVVSQKRRTATVYMRAIDAVGELRLDLFAAFWDFLHRAGADNNLIPTSQWLTHWLCWCAEQAIRKHPLKSCCWIKAFEVSKKFATAELDNLGAFVQEICREGSGILWKCLMAPPWFHVDEVLPPPFRLDDAMDFSLASEEVLQTHTGELLHCVCEILKTTEEVFRLYYSQNRLFPSTKDTGGDATQQLSADLGGDELFTCTDHILSLINNRLVSMMEYLTLGDKVPLATIEGRPLTVALFTSLLHVHIYRGIQISRLTQSTESFEQLFATLDEFVEGFLALMEHTARIEADVLALMWNVKISLLLAATVCSDLRYFNNLKGSWISSLLIRGDLCPRVIAQAFTEQTFDVSFELIFERLTADPDLQRLTQRPLLFDKLVLLSEAASLGAAALEKQHPLHILLRWLGDLNSCLANGSCWQVPEDMLEDASSEITIFKLTALPPPSTFPKLGAPVHVALHELRSRPFPLSQPLRGRSPASQAEQYPDLASISSSSSHSSSAAVDLILLQRNASPGDPASVRFASPAAKTAPSFSPRPSASPVTSATRPTGETLTSVSPSRRLSAEDVEKLTRATRDGREAPLPSLAPGVIPAALPHATDYMPPGSDPLGCVNDTVSDEVSAAEFPPARSPLIISGARRRSAVDFIIPQSLLKPSTVVPSEDVAILGNPVTVQKKAETQDATGSLQTECANRVQPQKGHHYLQLNTNTTDKNSLKTLLGMHIEWRTLWISNLERSVTKEQLTAELASCDCEGLIEVRLVTDYKGRSKGYAYVDFETPEAARLAEQKIGGRLINGLKIKALISVPKNPIYEEKTVFLSNVPAWASSTIVHEALMKLAKCSDVIDLPVSSRKRLATERSTDLRAHAKKLKSADSTTLPSAAQGVAQSSHNRHENQENTTEGVRSDEDGNGIHPDLWTVVEVRLVNKQDSNTTYGFVELDSKESTVRLLETQQKRPDIFNLKGEQFSLSPSIPKKQISHVTAPTKQSTTKAAGDDHRKRSTLHVTNLPWKMTQQELEAIFLPYGKIVRTFIPQDPSRKKRNLGFGFLEFDRSMDCIAALSALDGYEAHGRSLSIRQSSRIITEPKSIQVRECEISHDRTAPDFEASEVKPRLQLRGGPQRESQRGDTVNDKDRHVKPVSNFEFRKLLMNP